MQINHPKLLSALCSLLLSLCFIGEAQASRQAIVEGTTAAFVPGPNTDPGMTTMMMTMMMTTTTMTTSGAPS